MEGDGETDGKEGKERSAMNKRWTKSSEWWGWGRGGGDRRGVTARNGYKSEQRERRLDFSGLGGGGGGGSFRENKSHLNIKQGLWGGGAEGQAGV